VAKEPYIDVRSPASSRVVVECLPSRCTQELYTSAKKPYFAEKVPYIAAKESYASAKKPYISGK